MSRSRLHRIIRSLLRGFAYVVVATVVIAGLGLAAIQTTWGRNAIRRLIVREANQRLTASLEIGRLDGSFLNGITLANVRLSQGGETIISVDEVSVSYTIPEILEPGPIVRRIELVRPHIVVERLPDGRWNLEALIKPRNPPSERPARGRPIHVLSIAVSDGEVEIRDPLSFGAVRVPSRFGALNASLSVDYEPDKRTTIQFANAAWTGDRSNITVERLAGGLSVGPDGWIFNNLTAQTPHSLFTLTGQIERGRTPTTIDLRVAATRFAFQEWSGVLDGFKDIAIESGFDLSLHGPLAKLSTVLKLQSTGGSIQGSFVLDTTVPGWHAAGAATVDRLNLARWLNRSDRPSDVSGRLAFDVDLDLGHKLPRGSFDFDGSHAAYLGYEADAVRARGTVTATDVRIADLIATAYGSNLHIVSGSIGIDDPYPYHLQGSDTTLDLRRLPASVPVTHVESLLAFDDFDVTGRFSSPYIQGRARLASSEYLGATIAAGAAGSIDTSVSPVRYSGEGDVSHLDIHRVGEALDVSWMADPRSAGVIAGHFRAEGTTGEGAAMTLDGGGHLARADMFGGQLLNADVTAHVGNGSLTGSYDGSLASINPALALGDQNVAARLTGSAQVRFVVRGLLERTAALADYDIDGALEARDSEIRGVHVDEGSIAARLAGATLDVSNLQVTGPTLDARGTGTLELDGQRSSSFEYNVARADLSLASDTAGHQLSGTLVTTGHVTGPTTALRVAGDATISDAEVDGAKARTAVGQYDLTVPWDDPGRTSARLSIRTSLLDLFDRHIPEATGTFAYADRRLDADVLVQSAGCPTPGANPCTTQALPNVGIAGSITLHAGEHAVDVSNLTVTLGRSPWRLTDVTPPPTISWNDDGLETMPLTFVDGVNGTQQIGVSGTWRTSGTGALRVTARRVFLDTLLGDPDRPAVYGGVMDLDATVSGTRDKPAVTADITVTEGRVRKLTYDRLAGRIEYAGSLARVDARLDQGPDTWLTAKGSVPLALLDKAQPDQPVDLSIASSAISLGLLEGVTDIVRDMSGRVTLNVNATGTVRAPLFSGSVAFADAGFLVNATGARYKNGRASFDLAADRLTVSAFHLEDRNGHALTLTGTLGVRELSVGDVQIDAVASRFEVLHDDIGTMDVDAKLRLRGDLNAPGVAGDVTIRSGELQVDQILERTLFQPYTTQAAPAPARQVDALAALNPWDRLALDLVVHSPRTLRLTGDNVQIAQGTPLGLGSFNVRATGDLYLDKDPGQPFYVTGSFNSLSGSYAFQGRRFDIDPASSINFRGDLNPELYISVSRLISGVDTRVTIVGPLHAPELRLASTPPLEASDILSLIVFNVSTSNLNPSQQQDLAARAGALAYGFVGTPLVAALQRSLRLETLEIAAPDALSTGPRVTVGNEVLPGIVAQFTRQFGDLPYDQATIEYAISRMLRLRGTFSDASSDVISPFQRIERAGVDLILFFSF